MPPQPQTSAEPMRPVSLPDITVSVRQTFGIDSDMQVPAFSTTTEHVPSVDDAYRFDRDTTMAILAGFAITGGAWCRAITAPANPPISSRWRRG